MPVVIPAAKASAAQSKGCLPDEVNLDSEFTSDHVGTAALGCYVDRSSTGIVEKP